MHMQFACLQRQIVWSEDEDPKADIGGRTRLNKTEPFILGGTKASKSQREQKHMRTQQEQIRHNETGVGKTKHTEHWTRDY